MSNSPNSYFEAILALRRDIAAGLPASEYKQMIKRHSVGSSVAVGPAPPPPKAGGVVLLNHDSDDEDPRPAPKARPPPPITLEGPVPIPASSGPVGCLVPEAPPVIASNGPQLINMSDDEGAGPGEIPGSSSGSGYRTIMIEGHGVSYRPAFVSETRHEHPRYIVDRCPIHPNDQCNVSRSIRMDEAAFGQLGTRLYIGAWLLGGLCRTAEEHNNYVPDMEDMTEYGRERGLLPS